MALYVFHSGFLLQVVIDVDTGTSLVPLHLNQVKSQNFVGAAEYLYPSTARPCPRQLQTAPNLSIS